MNNGIEGFGANEAVDEALSFEEELLRGSEESPQSLNEKLFDARVKNILEALEGDEKLREAVLRQLSKKIGVSEVQSIESENTTNYEVGEDAKQWLYQNYFDLDIEGGRLIKHRSNQPDMEISFSDFPGGVGSSLSIKTIRSVNDVIKIEWSTPTGEQKKLWLGADGYLEVEAE
ncbi:MAG: hypothetical protein K8Q91_02975 [Candidatus Vogelbacteria bacterium]|nr:hypothetical protein [Candidatus Vogelbacteria bacterium]